MLFLDLCIVKSNLGFVLFWYLIFMFPKSFLRLSKGNTDYLHLHHVDGNILNLSREK